MKQIKISPSLLSADFSCLRESMDSVKSAEMLHLDVMDGHFVPNITFGPCVIRKIRPHSDQIFDTHLMIQEPRKYIQDFVDAGSDYITIHAESHDDTEDMLRSLDVIRDAGAKTALSINPATPWKPIKELIPELDMILIMTVVPGFGGQGFMHEVVPKIKEIREYIDDAGSLTEISVDGGISPKTAPDVVKAGADILVAGSAIFKGDAKTNLERLRESTRIH